MLKNYFKIAWRYLIKNKVSSFVNILGLAVGMAVAMLIGCWIWDEISFDNYHQKHASLGVVLSTTTYNNETTTAAYAPAPLANELRSKYADDFKQVALISEIKDHVLTMGDKNIPGAGMWVENEFPGMFTLKKIKGNLNALHDPSYVLISESMAKSLFGNIDPLNKTLQVDNNFNLKVGAVYEDLPSNSRFSGIQLLLPWNNGENADNQENQWYNHHFSVYVEMNSKLDFDKVNAKIKDVAKPYLKAKSKEEIMLQPLDKAYLYNEYANGKVVGGRIKFVRLFAIIGIFVLLLACINFMNLSTAKSEKRAKEVGMRKALGSIRRQLIFQFLCESMLVTALAFILSVVLVYLSLPFFNELAGKEIKIPWSNTIFWIIIAGFTIFTGLISGSYPAFYLSKFQPIKVLKGTFKTGGFDSLFRRVLVVVQFTVSIVLIIGTLVVFLQIQFAKNRPVEYKRNGLITIEMKTPEIFGHYNALREDLLQTGAVEDMTESSSLSTDVRNSMVSFDWEGRDTRANPLIGLIAVTHDYGKTIGWSIKDGREFSRNFPADSSDGGSFILNEAAVKLTGFKHPVGNKIRLGGMEHTITGVIKDMVMESPYSPAQPTVFWLNYNWRTSYITLRIKPVLTISKSLDKVAAVFKKYDPASPFEYQFTDEAYAAKFFDEERIGNLATLSAILAIFISCLGLFGLASFVAEQRTKEIGLRKILGASVFNLWCLLSKEFSMLVIISLCIAAPLAYAVMHNWLQNYQYRTTISWWIFLSTGIGVLAITLLTVSYQSIRAAMMNPVKSLSSE